MFLDNLNAASRHMLLDLEKLVVQYELAKLATIRNGEIIDPEGDRAEYFINYIDKLEDDQCDLDYYGSSDFEELASQVFAKVVQRPDIKQKAMLFIIENNIDMSEYIAELGGELSILPVISLIPECKSILLSSVGTKIISHYCNEPDLYNLSLQQQKMILFEIFKLQSLFNNSDKGDLVMNFARAYQAKSKIDDEYFEEIKAVALRPMKDIYDIINE